MSTPDVIRMAKIMLVASFGAFAALVTLGNLVDPMSNFTFVEHVLSMDTTFRSPSLMGRAIEARIWHQLAFGLIIAGEAAVACLWLVGAFRLARVRRAEPDEFHAAKAPALLGLLLGLALWFVGFQVIGGEWFASWQSATWNGLDAATRATVFLLGTLIFVSLKND